MGDDAVVLHPIIDPESGGVVYTAGESVSLNVRQPQKGMTMGTNNFDWQHAEQAQDAGLPVQIIDGELVGEHNPHRPGQSVTLVGDRFAADFDWERADQAANAGQAVQIVDGQLVPVGGKPTDPAQSVTLTGERFAATTGENAEITRLMRSGAASLLISDLRPTSAMSHYFPRDPRGWYLRTKPTPSFGDELHAVIIRESATGLYHSRLWRMMQNDRGQLKNIDLNRWVGTVDALSAHNTHLYPGHNGEAAVLCLSQRPKGGMPDLTGAVMQSAKWADGMGYVVRGRGFPYRQ